jgi:hypothetical protein
VFTAGKSLTRPYGYTVLVPPGTTWAPHGYAGWYRRKADAQRRANVLNAAR